MDDKDQAPVVLLGLYAGLVLVPSLWSGFGLAMSALALGFGFYAGVSQDPLSLAFTGVGAVLNLARMVAALATSAFAATAAWRTSNGDDRLLRSASLAAAVVSVLAAGSSFLTLACCDVAMWAPPTMLALVAALVVHQRSRDTTHPGWGGEA